MKVYTPGYRLIALTSSTFLAGCLAILMCRADTIDEYIRAQMRKRSIPGISIAVVDGGKLVRAERFGFIGADSRIRVTAKTLFQAASISKLVSAVGAMRLVQDGVLSLDSDVNLQLKSWKVAENEFTKDQRVTLRRLLSHTGGVSPADFNGYWPDAQLPTLRQILEGQRPANSLPIRVDEVPGSEGRYSGGGYVVLRQLIEDATGSQFKTWMNNRILTPVGMVDSSFEQPLPASMESRAAMGNIIGITGRRGKWRVFPELAPDGLWSTPTDLVRFIIGVQESATGAPNSILNNATVTQMLTVETDNSGLGPGIRGQGQSLRFLHAGSQWGFTSLLMAYAHNGKGAVIMMNSNDTFGVVPRIMQVIAARHINGPDTGAYPTLNGHPPMPFRQKNLLHFRADSSFPTAQ